MLNNSEMTAAHFARQNNLDPVGTPTTGDAKADKENRLEIDRGNEILAKYSLSYSARFTIFSPNMSRDKSVAGFIRISAGHIATAPAYRLAIFRVRS